MPVTFYLFEPVYQTVRPLNEEWCSNWIRMWCVILTLSCGQIIVEKYLWLRSLLLGFGKLRCTVWGKRTQTWCTDISNAEHNGQSFVIQQNYQIVLADHFRDNSCHLISQRREQALCGTCLKEHTFGLQAYLCNNNFSSYNKYLFSLVWSCL